LGKYMRRNFPGLIKMGVRFYDPQTARFLSRDPLKGEDEIPITQNPYIYANDDPVNMMDIMGLRAMGNVPPGAGESNPMLNCDGFWDGPHVWSGKVSDTDTFALFKAPNQVVRVRCTISYDYFYSDDGILFYRLRYCGWRVWDMGCTAKMFCWYRVVVEGYILSWECIKHVNQNLPAAGSKAWSMRLMITVPRVKPFTIYSDGAFQVKDIHYLGERLIDRKLVFYF
ncbi:MAG: hypothetical protein PHP64_03705, partial [Actinomycetota bacterium]|nr:hypothetical protein [Actinomycetota bacterium]